MAARTIEIEFGGNVCVRNSDYLLAFDTPCRGEEISIRTWRLPACASPASETVMIGGLMRIPMTQRRRQTLGPR